MWHEARKQERLIRGMIVDYRRRAERRRHFYEKIKADPAQFLQIHGRPCKIHLDPAVAVVGDSMAVMMPWQGDATNQIDRFDVRAHLDFIPDLKYPDIPVDELSHEERHCNYERYRILAQNSFLGINEEKFLRQLEIEEQFGVTLDEKEQQKEKLNEKKNPGVAIGYNYDDSTAQSATTSVLSETKFNNQGALKTVDKDKDDSDDGSDFEMIDVDLSIDVNKVEPAQAHELNSYGPFYGMAGCDLFSFLTGDADDAEQQKQIMREEKEKAMFSGRKSRRERRAQRDKKLALRVVTTPSYALGPLPDTHKDSRSRSRSRSHSRTPSPSIGGGIQFITSFGGDDDADDTAVVGKMSYADKVKHTPVEKRTYAAAVRDTGRISRRSPSPRKGSFRSTFRSSRFDRSRTRSRSRRTRSHSRSKLHYRRSRSRSDVHRRSRSRPLAMRYRRSRSLNKRSRSRSRSRDSRHRTSRSRSRFRSKSRCSSSGGSNSSRSTNRRGSPGMSVLSSGNIGGSMGESAANVPRYYGRRAISKSSSELSIDSQSSDDQSNHKDKSNDNPSGTKASTYANVNRLSGAANKSRKYDGGDKMSLKERLKKKMQAQLSRQLRADKKAEAERLEREQQQQLERDEEMREMAIKIRRKQREMRHQRSHYSYSPGSGSGESPSSSPRHRRRSSDRDNEGDRDRDHSRRRVDHDRHDSPARERRKIPVWQHEEDQMRNDERRDETGDHSRSRHSRWSSTDRRRRSSGSDGQNSPVRKLVDY